MEQKPYHSSLARECILLITFKKPISYIMVNLHRKWYGTKCHVIIYLKNRTPTLHCTANCHGTARKHVQEDEIFMKREQFTNYYNVMSRIGWKTYNIKKCSMDFWNQNTFRFLTIRLYVSSSCLFLCFLALSRAPSASAPIKEKRISRLTSLRTDRSNHQCYTSTVPTCK